ncbi:hypothetical protein HK100_009366, partial [Physocladia obscura]
MTNWKRVVGVGAVGIGVGASWWRLLPEDERAGVRRGVVLWTQLGPVVARYRLEALRHAVFATDAAQRQTDYARLDERHADDVLATLQRLRGFYVKAGQFVAQRSDVVSAPYVQRLRSLEDAVPPLLDGDGARAAVRAGLGLAPPAFDAVFAAFDAAPLGSASIGQVHRAVLRRDGKHVAVKILSPGAERLFAADFATARAFCAFFSPEQLVMFDEIEAQFVNEFDYRVEASNLNKMHKNMTPHFGSLIVVPRAYPEFCSRTVLTMDYLDGIKLVDGVRNVAREWCERNGTSLETYEFEMREKYLREGLPPAYTGPSATAIDLYTAFVRLSDATINFPFFLYNSTLACFLPPSLLQKVAFSYRKSFIPLNSARIMDTLLKVHGHQVLIDGFLNGDPHPGNFLLLNDGRIGLLDMGQIKVLDYQQRLFIARLYKALADGDREGLKTLCVD